MDKRKKGGKGKKKNDTWTEKELSSQLSTSTKPVVDSRTTDQEKHKDQSKPETLKSKDMSGVTKAGKVPSSSTKSTDKKKASLHPLGSKGDVIPKDKSSATASSKGSGKSPTTKKKKGKKKPVSPQGKSSAEVGGKQVGGSSGQADKIYSSGSKVIGKDRSHQDFSSRSRERSDQELSILDNEFSTSRGKKKLQQELRNHREADTENDRDDKKAKDKKIEGATSGLELQPVRKGGSSAELKTKKKIMLQEEAVRIKQKDDEDYAYDEDNFYSDYDDDFEGDDNDSASAHSMSDGASEVTARAYPKENLPKDSTVAELMHAMEKENKQVLSSDYNPSVARNMLTISNNRDQNVLPPRVQPFQKVMDFASAQKKTVHAGVSRNTKKRGEEILSLIEMDFVSFDMFDLPPLSEYEIYVKKFGSDTSRQMAVQTGEDNLEQETQTDSVPMSSIWVQCPPNDYKGYGREEEEEKAYVDENALKLVSFLKKASQVCSVLLEENLAARDQVHSKTAQSQFPFCGDQFTFQNVPSALNGWHVNDAHFNQSQDHLIVASYSNPALKNGMGVVCVWNIRVLFEPNVVLLCQCATNCCCYSPFKASLVFAGCDDGSVVLWDLREPLSMHQSLRPDTPYIGRSATFSTAGIPSLANHQAPVLSIAALTTTEGSSSSANRKESSQGVTDLELELEENDTAVGLSFQLATLDQSGILKLWVVVELTSGDPYGSVSDFGLIPGGRVKLVKSASIDLSVLPGRGGQRLQPSMVHCMTFHPRDTNHIYVGTGSGCVDHHTRYGQRAIPSRYLPPQTGEKMQGELGNAGAGSITSISFSIEQPDYFLVSCFDGSIRIHHTKGARALHYVMGSTGGVAIRSIQWVEHCPGIVLVLDHASKIYMWDLVENDAEPIFNKQLESKVTFCTVNSSPTTGKTSLLLAYGEGTLEFHSINPLPHSISERQQLFSNYLDSLL